MNENKSPPGKELSKSYSLHVLAVWTAILTFCKPENEAG